MSLGPTSVATQAAALKLGVRGEGQRRGQVGTLCLGASGQFVQVPGWSLCSPPFCIAGPRTCYPPERGWGLPLSPRVWPTGCVFTFSVNSGLGTGTDPAISTFENFVGIFIGWTKTVLAMFTNYGP